MSESATAWAANAATRTAQREARTVQWQPGIDPAALRPDDVLVLHGTRHRLGNVTYDRVEGTGEVTRAAAYSLRIGRWINLLTGEVRRVEGDPEPALAPADIPAYPSPVIGEELAHAAALSPWLADRLRAEAAGPEPVYPAPGSSVPNQPGYVVGDCTHRVARSEWAAGLRTCERC